MKEPVKCPRCGKEYVFTYKNIARNIECTHCHRKMTITRNSSIWYYVVSYGIAMIIVLIATLILTLMGVENSYVSIAIVVVVVLVVMFMEHQVLWIQYNIMGLKYQPVEVAPKTNTNTKTNTKKKK